MLNLLKFYYRNLRLYEKLNLLGVIIFFIGCSMLLLKFIKSGIIIILCGIVFWGFNVYIMPSEIGKVITSDKDYGDLYGRFLGMLIILTGLYLLLKIIFILN